MAIQLTPIGHVRAAEDGFRLAITADNQPALEGLEGFSHLIVIWWCHLLDTQEHRGTTVCAQPYKHAPATLGIFATRSPARPNPIAISPVSVLEVDVRRGLIYIPYIDAEDGTPILDLKPYLPAVDRIGTVQVPAWCRHWPQCYEDSASFDWAAEFVNAR